MEDNIGEDTYLGEMIGGAGLALSPWSFGGAFPYYIHGHSRTTSKQLSPYVWMAYNSFSGFFFVFFVFLAFAAKDTPIPS